MVLPKSLGSTTTIAAGKPFKGFFSPFSFCTSNPVMSNYGTNTIHRPPPTTSQSLSIATQADDSKASTRKNFNNFKLKCPFNLPPTPEAAAVQIIRNLSDFGVYYVLFMWVILFIALLPKIKVSLVLLVVMTAVTCLYLLLLRLVPNSVVLHKVIDKRLVFALVAIVTAVEMILTRAAIHFSVTVAAATLVIMVHAVLRVREDLFVNEENCSAGELVPLMHNRITSNFESSTMV